MLVYYLQRCTLLQAYWYPANEIATMMEKATALYPGAHVSISLQHTTVTIKILFIITLGSQTAPVEIESVNHYRVADRQEQTIKGRGTAISSF